MKPQSRLVFFTLVTLLVMVVNLAMPVSVLADDSAPPETPPAEAPPEEAPPPEEPVSLPEVLEQAPPDTQVVVVNEEGQVEPLATVAAAEILVTADPMWCPVGTTPGAGGCTGSFVDMASLIAALAADAALPTPVFGGQAGIIWVEDSYNGNDNSELNLNGSVLTTMRNYDLNIRGGWSGGNNTTITGTSTFDVALNVINWFGNITLEDLDFAGANDTSASLVVDTTGNITVDDVTVTGNTTGTGASLDSCQLSGGLCAGTGNVTVTDSTFSGNNFIGLTVDSGGTTTLTNVTANGNLGPDGVFIIGEDDSAVTHNVTVSNSTFSGNVNGTGLEVFSDGNVTLNNVTAGAVPAPLPGNNTGAIIDTTFGTGNVTVTGGQYNDNDWDGLDVYSGGNITVSNVVISDNSSPGLDTYGAYLDATHGIGDISVSNSTFNNNDGYGVFGIANNNVTLTNVNVNGGGITDDGALIKSIDGTATVNGGTFTNNTKSGLIAIGGALMNLVAVDLVNVNVTANLGDGAQVYSTFTYACFGTTGILVNVDNGDFSGNSGPGLTVKPGPEGMVTVTGTQTFDVDDAMVIDLGNPCLGKDEEKPEEGKPVNIVEVPFKDGDPVEQDCGTYSGTLLMLPDGTWVKFGCPFEGSMTLEGLLEEELPGTLGAGAEFVSAITYGMTDLGGLEVTVNPDGTITLKFKIPEDSNARAYDILYWDTSANNGAGAWVTLPQYKIGQPQAVALNPGNPEDGRLITSGVKQKGEYVTVTVNFTGTFVLVAR